MHRQGLPALIQLRYVNSADLKSTFAMA